MPEPLNPTLSVEIRDLNSIRPYEKNPRLNDKAVDAVAASLKEFGFRQPVVVDSDGIIIAGHTRWKAAKKLGITKIPVHIATDLSPEQVKAYRLADNKTGEIAEWDFEILPIELAELQNSGFDMSILAFGEKELTQLLNVELKQGQTDPDAVPEPPDDPITRKGDLWILGNHRLFCGDSSKPEDVDYLLDGNIINLVNSDPPYNICVESRSNNSIAVGLSNSTNTHHQNFDVERHPEKSKGTTKKLRAKDRPLANDFLSDEEFEKLLDAWFGNMARVLQPGGSFYIWGGFTNCGNYPPYLKKHDLYFSQAIIWDKGHPVLTRKDFMTAHEWCFYGWKLGAAHKFYGPNNATDLWPIKKINPTQMVHLTQKPGELAARAIQYSSKPGDNVLELFGGSGWTLIACEQTGRNCFSMEIDELYCDIIVQRWQEFTGRKAERIPAKGAADE